MIKGGPQGFDKIAHLFLYAGLGYFALRAFLKKKSLSLSDLVIVLGYCISVAILDEAYQGSIPNRTSDFLDLFFDFVGLVAGIAIRSKHRKF